MPSGAKKRKAARRRKEQEQQQRLGGGTQGTPSSIADVSYNPPHGNGLDEENDHDSKESESGSDVSSPTAQPHDRNLEISGAADQSGPEVEFRIENSMKDSGIELTGSGVGESTTEEGTADFNAEAADVGNDEDTPLTSLSYVPPIPVENHNSKPRAACSEKILSEKDKDVSVLREVPPTLVELKQHELPPAEDLAVEQAVNISITEDVVRRTTSPAVDAVMASTVPLLDATTDERDPVVDSHPTTRGRQKTTRNSEV